MSIQITRPITPRIQNVQRPLVHFGQQTPQDPPPRSKSSSFAAECLLILTGLLFITLGQAVKPKPPVQKPLEVIISDKKFEISPNIHIQKGTLEEIPHSFGRNHAASSWDVLSKDGFYRIEGKTPEMTKKIYDQCEQWAHKNVQIDIKGNAVVRVGAPDDDPNGRVLLVESLDDIQPVFKH